MNLPETLSAFTLLLSQLIEEEALALQSHMVMVEIKAQREVVIGNLQVHVDQAIDGSLYLGGIIYNESENSWLIIWS